MNGMLRASAFHARTSAVNALNAWTTRNGVTLASAYSSTSDEILAARTRAGLADLAARWQVMLEGSRVVDFLRRLLTRDVDTLSPGSALKALWLTDFGGVRGAGVVARYGKESFWLLSAAQDENWIAEAAKLFGVTVRDVSAQRSGIAVIGPYARATIEDSGVQCDLEPLRFRKASWRGIEILLSRFGEHGGFELWCDPSDATLVWDRISRAGAGFDIVPLGTAATDALDVEAGIPRPFLDYIPAMDGRVAEPLVGNLGLESLVDADHATFNGRAEYLSASQKAAFKLTGVEIDSDCAAPHTPLYAGEQIVGRTLSSHYSPSLRRAIALAQLDRNVTAPGTTLSLTLPPSICAPELRMVPARVVDLPFLGQPDSLTA